MRAFLSAAAFVLAWWLLAGRFGVVGLWWALIIFVVARAIALLLYLPGLRASIAPLPDQSEENCVGFGFHRNQLGAEQGDSAAIAVFAGGGKFELVAPPRSA